jgi:hypothetical protein
MNCFFISPFKRPLDSLTNLALRYKVFMSKTNANPKMKIFIFLVVFFHSFFLFSQNGSINGRIMDDENDPLSFVTVLIYDGEASEPFNGITTDENGVFSFSGIEEKEYRITFSFI